MSKSRHSPAMERCEVGGAVVLYKAGLMISDLKRSDETRKKISLARKKGALSV